MTTTNEVVLSAVGELLRAAGGNGTLALEALLTHAKDAVVVAEKSTVASRKAEYRQMLDDYDVDELAEAETMMSGLVARIAENDLTSETGVLSALQAKSAMEEHLDSRKVTELLDVRKDVRKAAIFGHIDAVLAAEGVGDPQNHNGALEVPGCGMKFSREGAGYNDPSIDEGRLRMMLGEDTWHEVCTGEEIPAHIEYTLDLAKLLDRATGDPTLYGVIEECLAPGQPKTPRLNVRKL